MKICPTKIIKLILPLFVLFLTYSCNKDSDLLADYVVERPIAILASSNVTTFANNPIVIDPLKGQATETSENIIINEVTPPTMGTAVVNKDNTITYTPDKDKTGTDVFDYSAAVTNPDNSLTKETGSVTVTVTEKKTSSGGRELKAFPTAEGYGRYATGGRGKAIYTVTNTNDSGVGSFRKAVNDADANNGGTIVFTTGGTVNLQSSIIIGSNGAQNITIAGETAPGDGFGVRMSSTPTYGAAIEIRGSNTIIRHIRIHVDEGGHGNADGLRIHNQWNRSGGYILENVIADHLSIYWTTDEAIEIGSYNGNTIRNITIQNCLIAEPFDEGYGPLIFRNLNPSNPSSNSNITFYGCMFNDVVDRSPSGTVSGLNYEIINCIKYNVKNNTLVQYGNDVDYIGNIIKSASIQPNLPYQKKVFNYDPNTNGSPYAEPDLSPTTGSVWDDDNIIIGDATGNPMYNSAWITYKSTSRVNTDSGLIPMSSSLVSDYVTKNVGTKLWRSVTNDHDTRVINNYINGTGGHTTSQAAVGGNLTYATGTAYVDTDSDNMWDVAEIALWGSIEARNNPIAIEDGDGYTNIEKTFFYFTGE